MTEIGTEERIVDQEGVLAPAQEFLDALMASPNGFWNRFPSESFSKIKMQPYIHSTIGSQCGGTLGIFHENHPAR